MMTFRVWLRQYEKAHTPIGDLARDVRHDKEFPRTRRHGFSAIESHLVRAHAIPEAISAARRAWNLYAREAFPDVPRTPREEK